MISLELAKKLKDAGLKWEPKRGDWFKDGPHTRTIGDEFILPHVREYLKKANIWLPSLSQLLAEIEGRGYDYRLERYGKRNIYRMALYKDGQLVEVFDAPDTENACASALLWILEVGGNDKTA